MGYGIGGSSQREFILIQKGEKHVNQRVSYSPVSEKRLVSAQEGADYVSMGTASFRQWAKEIGAEKRLGRLVRYDRRIIDDAVSSMGTENK